MRRLAEAWRRYHRENRFLIAGFLVLTIAGERKPSGELFISP